LLEGVVGEGLAKNLLINNTLEGLRSIDTSILGGVSLVLYGFVKIECG